MSRFPVHLPWAAATRVNEARAHFHLPLLLVGRLAAAYHYRTQLGTDEHVDASTWVGSDKLIPRFADEHTHITPVRLVRPQHKAPIVQHAQR